MRMAKGQRFMHIRAETGGKGSKENPPVFSEEFLYSRLGKDDARFVLGVAEEYEKVITTMGTATVWEMLSTEERINDRKNHAANALYSARRALNDAAAALCANCKKGLTTEAYRPEKPYNEIWHEVKNPDYKEGDGWDKRYIGVRCTAEEQRKALSAIRSAIQLGEVLGIDTDPAPHKFVPATHPPESWCQECWLDLRESFHNEDRILEAAEWKQ